MTYYPNNPNGQATMANSAPVVIASDQTTLPVGGNIASGSADSGNPAKVGGRYNSTLPTFTNGQRGDFQIGTRGSLRVELFNSDSATAIAVTASGADGVSNSLAGYSATYTRNSLYNGSTWDRAPGNATDGTLVNLGANNDVVIAPATSGGLTTVMASGSDGSTALTSTAQVVKASAGQLFGYYIYNPNSSAQFVHFYNTAAASVTVGTTNPLFTLTIPATSAANLMGDIGITFSNAGWSWAATATAGGNGAPSTALDAVAWIK